MNKPTGIVAMVAIALVMATGAITSTAANAAIVSTVGLGTVASHSITSDPSDPLTILGVALTGIGVLLLRGRPIRHF
ncbi:MAG TPA: hypothetical protein VNE19_03520 [Methylomirabilota bacterium]|jgi:hypothetical protein|nr:hypothetical protein [Methylomirabilota bacterium]